jgi:hypothetical protein
LKGSPDQRPSIPTNVGAKHHFQTEPQSKIIASSRFAGIEQQPAPAKIISWPTFTRPDHISRTITRISRTDTQHSTSRYAAPGRIRAGQGMSHKQPDLAATAYNAPKRQ